MVIPNWNGEHRLPFLLASLQEQTERPWEVLVVDNGSTDASKRVTEGTPGLRWIGLDRNHGFARAVNQGIGEAKGEAVAIVNNDVKLAPDCLQLLAGALSGTVAFAAPKILMADGPARIDGTFDLTSRGFCSWRAGHGLPASAEVWNRPRPISSAPMTAALFRRDVFDRAGLLDEQFGSYLEDVDFGLRCALSGLQGRYVPQAVAWHEGSATLGGQWNATSVRLISRNQVLLRQKYHGSLWPSVVGQYLWGLSSTKRGMAGAWLQGKLEGYRLRPEQPYRDGTEALDSILKAQEQQIRELFAESGAREPWYWKSYFFLTGGANQ